MSAAANLSQVGYYGEPLSPHDYTALERSYITREVAISARLRRINNEDAKLLVGRHDSEDYSGIVFPYSWPGEQRARAHRLRRDNPPVSLKKGKPELQAKYLSAPGWSNQLYFHPDTPASILTDTSVPLYFTEGQKKCLALWTLFRENKRIAQPVALNGVWGMRGKTGIGTNSNGGRQQIKGPIPDFDRIEWTSRQVFIVFDTNVGSNVSVAAARNELANDLTSRGAIVFLIDIEPEDGVNGVDDFLGKHGGEAGQTLLESARLFDPSEKIAALPFSDLFNEQIFEMFYGEDYRFNHTGKEWLRWNGNYWEADSLCNRDRAMVRVARARTDATAKIADDDERKKALARALKLGDVKSRLAALESAKSNPKFAKRAVDFDQAGHLLACANGVINLATGELRPGRRSDMLTMATRVEYNPLAPQDPWLKFLDEVFEGNAEMIAFLQRAVGYSLTASIMEEIFFICHGSGRNGKGVFLRVLAEVLGDYGWAAEFSTLLASGATDSRKPRNDIAAMAGRRFVMAQESREGAKFDESMVKTLTGGDLITARFLNKELFTFKPTWKIWLATNHRPEIKGTDTGIWSRPRLIPFNVSFEGREDKHLKQRLLKPENLSGVLTWAVEGCLLLQKEGGLRYPEAVLAATARYKADSDLLGRFIEECCTKGDSFHSNARYLYSQFSKWASDTGEEGIAEKAFSLRMKDLGFKKERNLKGIRWLGICLRENPNDSSSQY